MTLLEETIHLFERAGLADPEREAAFLLAEVLGCHPGELPWVRRESLPTEQAGLPAAIEAQIREWGARRAARYPLAYVAGTQPFLGWTFTVTPDVLIPRPETELLVEQVWKRFPNVQQPYRFWDVGTGSGCIAIALAKRYPIAMVYATDVCPKALAIAERNARRLGVLSRVRFSQGSLWEALESPAPLLDAVAANLPYIASPALERLAPEVQREPRVALDGGPDGLRWISQLAAGAERVLKPGGLLALEIGYDQAPRVRTLLEQGSWQEVAIERDYAGHPRVVTAVLRGGECECEKRLL